ncbi:MAG: START domain-containing protein [Spirochaetes bacterium]|nr:START domain-containing protein [Spirochaetota bacterium]
MTGRAASFLLITVFLVATALLDAQSAWRLVRDESGIRVFTRDVADSDMDEFKAVTVINARIEVISEIFRDGPGYVKWMADCIEARIVKSIGRDTLIIYHATNAPWPVNDRDVVVKSRVVRDYSRGSFTAYLESFDTDLVPRRSDRVRMTKLTASFELAVVDREHTRVTYTVLADPAGSIPASVTNFFAKNNPHTTLKGLGRMAKLERYIEAGRKSADLPEVEKYFREHAK